MAGHVGVTARWRRMVSFANLMDIEHFARMDRAVTTGVRYRGHNNYAEKQPDQDQE